MLKTQSQECVWHLQCNCRTTNIEIELINLVLDYSAIVLFVFTKVVMHSSSRCRIRKNINREKADTFVVWELIETPR